MLKVGSIIKENREIIKKMKFEIVKIQMKSHSEIYAGTEHLTAKILNKKIMSMQPII